MTRFQIYDDESAPEGSRHSLRLAKAKFGLIPNMMAIMAESPALVNTYGKLIEIFDETAFSDTEKQLVMLEASHENACDYSMAIHSAFAQTKNVPSDVIEALRKGLPLSDYKLEALRLLVRTVVKNRGHVKEAEVKAFLDAGFTRAQIFDVLVGVGMKTLSNYTNHIAAIPLDTAFQPQAWKKAG